jgi:hypothetical protein
MKIRPVGAELFLADTRTDKTKLMQADPRIQGLQRPEKKNWIIKEIKVHNFQNARQARTGRNTVKSSSPNPPSSDSSPFVPVPTLLHKLATILLLAFSLLELVAVLWQCLCSESNKKNGEVIEYPQ